MCSTPVIQTAGHPARAYVTMLATLSAPTAAGVGVKSEVVYSTSGGAWVAVANSDQYTTLYGGATPQEVATAPFAVFDLPPNANVSVALRLSRVAGAGDITAACANRIQIANRNGNASPF